MSELECQLGGRRTANNMIVFTSLLVDLHLDIHVHAEDDQIAQDVQATNSPKYILVLKGDLLAGLHHHQDDDQVGTA